MKFFAYAFAALALSSALITSEASAVPIPPAQEQSSGIAPSAIETSAQGSTYVPMDSWIYPALDRLHALGYLDSAFLDMRPWTRLSIAHMLERTADRIDLEGGDDTEAQDIYEAVWKEVEPDLGNSSEFLHPRSDLDSVYTNLRGIGGTPLRDSYHLGQTIINDYGRPYQSGFNNYTGFSTRSTAGRWSLYFRGEFQHAPNATGYGSCPFPTDNLFPQCLANYLSNTIDFVPYNPSLRYDTIPAGQIASASNFRILEANLSYHVLGHEVSFGKNDHWLAPNQGSSFLWSNNAEDIYDFEINKIEPFRIPLVSRLLGPIRYDFFVGSLKGHTYPNDPWAHMEKISFKPTRNLEFGFDRLVIWGGKGHEPITLHTFIHSFFSFQNVPNDEKQGPRDPGARFSTFDFSYRLPYLRNWVTLYTDSLVHDDVSPIDTPRRSSVAPGIYLSHFPGLQHLDVRVEGDSTDPVSNHVQNGQFMLYETVQRQGPTNKGFLVGDWIGRENKGGIGWLTYHLSPQEDVQFSYRRDKASKAFLPGGTTQDDYKFAVTKRLLDDKSLEIKGWVQFENWKAPVYKAGTQSDTTGEVQITWYPQNQKIF